MHPCLPPAQAQRSAWADHPPPNLNIEMVDESIRRGLLMSILQRTPHAQPSLPVTALSVSARVTDRKLDAGERAHDDGAARSFGPLLSGTTSALLTLWPAVVRRAAFLSDSRRTQPFFYRHQRATATRGIRLRLPVRGAAALLDDIFRRRPASRCNALLLQTA
jgi:hypothetical protein